ncbi:hypothetical protein ACHWQZ_G017695 [Mnemiopsis leidyi]
MSPEPGDKYKPLDGEEQSSDVDKQEENKLTVEEMVNQTIGADESKLNLFKFLGLLSIALMSKMVGAILSYIPIFAGFLNYKDWECITNSTTCLKLMANFTDDLTKFYSRETICDNSLKPDVDFRWTSDRTSYAIEWGLICSEEGKGSNLQSFFFIGAFIGTIVGAILFDKYGRKILSLVAIAISVTSCFASSWVKSYEVMLALRIAHGFGAFVTVSGVELLTVEFTPSNLRNLGQLVSSFVWSIGAFCIIGVSYGIKKWNHIFLVEGFILASTFVVIAVCPESPRFQLIKGKEKDARSTFKKISKIFKTNEVPEKAEIVYKNYNQSHLEQVKDFKKYPLMLKNTLHLMVCWMVIACLSYGLLFSWGKLGTDIYTSILFSTLGSFGAKASGMTYFMIQYFGRKKAVIINFAAICLLFLACIPSYDVKIFKTWTLDNVVCLLTVPFFSGTWSSVLLLTKELSPTSHRGLCMSMCSAVARIGAFVGPYLTLLYNTIHPRGVFAIFGGMAAFAAILTCFNSDSTDKPIPATPEDLVNQHTDTGHRMLDLEESEGVKG